MDKKIKCTNCGSENVRKSGNGHRFLDKIPKSVWPNELLKNKNPPQRVSVKRFFCKDCKKIFIPNGEDSVIVLEG